MSLQPESVEDLDTEERKFLWDERHQVLLKLEVSALYHLKRERFFELFDKIFKAISVIGGSAALWKSTQGQGQVDIMQYIAIVITVCSSLSLVFSFSDRARRHAEFARSYRKLLSEIHKRGKRGFKEEDTNLWMAQACEIEAGEPLALSTLVVICQNEISIASGHQPSVFVPWWQRKIAHFFDMPQTKMESNKILAKDQLDKVTTEIQSN